MKAAEKVEGARLLDLPELESRSTVSRHTWRLWLRQGKLPAVRLGRRVMVDEQDYIRFVGANKAGDLGMVVAAAGVVALPGLLGYDPDARSGAALSEVWPPRG